MREVITEVIKKHIADAAAENDAERAIKKKIGNFLRLPSGTGTLRAVNAEPPPSEETDEVHETVPVHLERAKLDGDGIDVRCKHGRDYE